MAIFRGFRRKKADDEVEKELKDKLVDSILDFFTKLTALTFAGSVAGAISTCGGPAAPANAPIPAPASEAQESVHSQPNRYAFSLPKAAQEQPDNACRADRLDWPDTEADH